MHIHNKDIPPPIEELRLSKVDKPLERGRYTWEKKYSVVAIYLANGSLRDTEVSTGVPAQTIENWRKSPWWPDLVDQIKTAQTTQLNTKLSKLINKSLAVVEDTLEHGELILNNKTGELVRKPVGIRDATRAASELMQRQVQLNKTIQTEQHQATMEDTLRSLAQEFAKWNTKKSEIIEAEDVDYQELSSTSETPLE